MRPALPAWRIAPASSGNRVTCGLRVICGQRSKPAQLERRPAAAAGDPCVSPCGFWPFARQRTQTVSVGCTLRGSYRCDSTARATGKPDWLVKTGDGPCRCPLKGSIAPRLILPSEVLAQVHKGRPQWARARVGAGPTSGCQSLARWLRVSSWPCLAPEDQRGHITGSGPESG